MHKIILLVLISATLFGAEETGREFIQLRQTEDETRSEYLERIQPQLPVAREFMHATLLGDVVRYRKNNQSIEVKLRDMYDAQNYVPSLYERLFLKMLSDERPDHEKAKRSRLN
jgi:hypothetical protein